MCWPRVIPRLIVSDRRSDTDCGSEQRLNPEPALLWVPDCLRMLGLLSVPDRTGMRGISSRLPSCRRSTCQSSDKDRTSQGTPCDEGNHPCRGRSGSCDSAFCFPSMGCWFLSGYGLPQDSEAEDKPHYLREEAPRTRPAPKAASGRFKPRRPRGVRSAQRSLWGFFPPYFVRGGKTLSNRSHQRAIWSASASFRPSNRFCLRRNFSATGARR